MVDHVIDAGPRLSTAQPEGHHVVHLDSWGGRSLDGALAYHARPAEDVVNAQPPGLVVRDIIADLTQGLEKATGLPQN